MRAECLPFTEVPHLSRIYLDYLSVSHRVRAFYPKTRLSRHWTDWSPKRNFPPGVADVLERQNRQWGAGPATLANIQRLRAGAKAIVTGQQVVLFGGQMLAMYKALTAIKLAAEATAAGVPAVPIFWLATEDHDLAEVSRLRMLAPGQELRELAVHPPDVGANAPVGRVRLGPEAARAWSELQSAIGDAEITQLLREIYSPERTLGEAYGRLFAKLFAKYGLILIDNADPELHAIEKAILRQAAERTAELNEALLARSRALEEAGYHAQVKVTKSSTLIFAQVNGQRTAVQRINGQYVVGDEKLSGSELGERIESHPEDFSPNALLRPVVQDFLLPTLAYVGGPSEVAYFAQSAVLYEKLLGAVTGIVPRVSATIVEAKIANLLSKYGLSASHALAPEFELRELIGKRSLPDEVSNQLTTFGEQASGWEATVREAVAEVDPTLADAAKTSFSKIKYQMSRLERRVAAAHLRRNEDVARHAIRITNALYPHRNLQEREIAGAYFLARYGLGFLETVYDVLDARCPDHLLLFPGS
jgi:bacillithiol biosynthesis cysteine-adding enzyme BshC